MPLFQARIGEMLSKQLADRIKSFATDLSLIGVRVSHHTHDDVDFEVPSQSIEEFKGVVARYPDLVGTVSVVR